MWWRADQQKKKTAILDLRPNRSAINASHRTRPGCAPSLQQRQRVTAGLLFKTPNLFEKSELVVSRRRAWRGVTGLRHRLRTGARVIGDRGGDRIGLNRRLWPGGPPNMNGLGGHFQH